MATFNNLLLWKPRLYKPVLCIKRLQFTFISISICILAFLPLPAAAQQGISLLLENYTVQQQQGQVNLYTTVTINATLYNKDSVLPFYGKIDFGLRNNAQILTQTSIFDKPAYSGDTVLLQPGERVPAVFSIDITPAYFGPGPDVVVVWPICTAPVGDSIVIPLLIQDPNSIHEVKEKLFSYSINHNELMLETPGYENIIERVRIFDINGALVLLHNSPETRHIPLVSLPRGIYIAEVRISNAVYHLRFAR
ncbi:MAG: T9SS type A sorting domain-containing protein [Chitinophagales bacterium]|nr:T9SS type A sorting domain-containing protein [Chitinophagales bacterium]MDW8418741.1 T9SS type A sorting domain-containing protein [Chitinophagales bacterium]